MSDPTRADNAIVLYTGIPAQASMAAQFSQVMQIGTSLSYAMTGLILQADLTGQNYYEIVPYPANKKIYVYKTMGGVRTLLNSPFNYTFYTGDGEYVTLKADVNNGVISIKIWPPGGNEPSDALATSTVDANPLTNAGFAGVRTVLAGAVYTPMLDDFFVGDSGTDFVMENIRRETACWTDRRSILEPSGLVDWERYIVIEPTTPIWDGTQWVMFYTGHNRVNARLGRATSSDLITWTKYAGNPIMGGGAGGEAGQASMSQAILKDGIWYLYYSTGYGITGDGKVATSSDGITFSNPQVFILHDGQSWYDGVANKGIIIEDGVWKMLVEGNLDNITRYEVGLATSTDGFTWSLYSGNPLTSMQINTGIWAGARSIIKKGDYYHTWYQASFANLFPNNVAHAVSTDLINWTVKGNYPAFFREMESFTLGFADQVADPIIMEYGGISYIFYDVDRNLANAGQDAYTAVATCDMTLDELLSDTESDSLVGHWDLDESSISGISADDASGWGGTGIMYGSPTEVAGRMSEGMSFNGTDQYIDVGDVASLGIRSTITLSAWVKVPAFPDTDELQYIVGKGLNAGLTDESYYLRFNNDAGIQKIDFGTYRSSATHGTSWGHDLIADTWYLIAGTWDGSAYRLYVDGDLKMTTNDTTGPWDSTLRVLIGAADVGGTAGRFLEGSLDDVRIYNRALRDADIDALYDLGTPAAPVPEPTPAPVSTPEPVRSGGHRRTNAGIASFIAPSIGIDAGSISSRIPNTYRFIRTLSIGSSSEDVRNLQTFLNDQGFTVSVTGPGSRGQETSFFGPATRAALMRFQSHYNAEILSPWNLASATGFFGTYSKKKANEILGK